MKICILLPMVLASVAHSGLCEVSSAEKSSAEMDDLWLDFKTKHGKSYVDNNDEMHRRAIFEDNVNYITKHNIQHDLGRETFTLGINQFADMTLEEFKETFLGLTPPIDDVTNETKVFSGDQNVDYPATVDWRSKGFVTPVKDQRQCGSCWAFSSTGALEGQYARKYRQLRSFSEQNLVDCSRPQGNSGCQGGWMNKAFTYVRLNNGLDLENWYPYEARNGVCRYRPAGRGTTCKGFVNIAKNEYSLMAAVATYGPISIAIDVPRSFQLYRSGVYNDPACGSVPRHAVLAVGYGNSGGRPYWLVKNSWNTKWGMQGYIMMSKNKGNQCGIANYASYPLV